MLHLMAPVGMKAFTSDLLYKELVQYCVGQTMESSTSVGWDKTKRTANKSVHPCNPISLE